VEDLDVPGPRIGLAPAADLDPRDVRKPDVEHEELGPGLRRHRLLRVAEALADQVARGHVVIDDEHPGARWRGERLLLVERAVGTAATSGDAGTRPVCAVVRRACPATARSELLARPRP
jgi:hypothetical protein